MTLLRTVVVFLALFAAWPSAQPVFSGSEVSPPEEFAARRAKVIADIGDGVAIVLGTAEPPGEVPFRQNSQFFYLTGVAEPRAIVIIDGRAKQTTLFLRPRDARREQSQYGPALSPGPEAVTATGIADIQPRDQFTAAVTAFAADRRTFYTPFAAEVLGSQSQGDPTRMWAANRQDPWDGRDSREATFVEKLKAAAPQSEIKDLDPIVNGLRAVKSAREIAIIREATRIAGLGIMAGMRDAKPGMAEYELQAACELVFKKHGAYGASYFALIATGKNTYYTHYNRNTGILADGDLVQLDYAPDFKYYQSDVTRVFPANGKFTARQRELYTVYLRLYQAIMTSIKVHAPTIDVKAEAGRRMDAIIASFKFTDEKIKTAAINMAAPFHNPRAGGMGHAVGMEVHDVGGAQATVLEPGRIFTIEPQLRIEDEHIGVRLEDMLLITETGYENLSAFVPIEIADIERLMAGRGPSAARGSQQ
jgi:Xaa-Pro aminopeptidase